MKANTPDFVPAAMMNLAGIVFRTIYTNETAQCNDSVIAKKSAHLACEIHAHLATLYNKG